MIQCSIWAQSYNQQHCASKYVQEAVSNVEQYLATKGCSLPRNAPTPFNSDYQPILDASGELGPAKTSFFQSQVGVLQWIVELDRVDIITEVSMLSSHLALPRGGHLEVPEATLTSS